jgi:branched-chain amino acid aminotransferase
MYTQIIVYQLTHQTLNLLDTRPALLTDIAAQHPGIYTIARTYYQNRVLNFTHHLERLRHSAQLTGIALPETLVHNLREALRRCIDAAGFENTRFCISVPRAEPGICYLALEPFRPVPEAIKRAGVSVYTVNLEREIPQAKWTEWIGIRREARQDLPSDAYEAILLGQGDTLLEGTGSNFYAVMDGELYTAGEGVLDGTARAGLLEVAPAVLPVHLHAATLDDLLHLSEAMLTSSSRGVVPVVRIDGKPVNGGAPGPFTEALSRRYDDWVEAHLEPLELLTVGD